MKAWLYEPLPSEQQLERERCLRSYAYFYRTGWATLEDTTPIVWEPMYEAVCLHVESLLQGWLRVQLYKYAASQPGGVLPPEESQRPLPRHGEAREVELRRRVQVQHLWGLGRRLNVISPTGHVRYVKQSFRNLLVNMTTGIGKSRLISVFTTPWCWLQWPWASLQSFGISVDNLTLDSDRGREVIRSEWFQDVFRPWWSIREDSDAKSLYRNTVGGLRQARAYWARKTMGGRAAITIFDDPDDPDEVLSESARQATHNRYDTTLERRVADPNTAVRIFVQQSLHPEDLGRHVLKSGNCEHLALETEKIDPDNKEDGCECATHKRGHTAIGWKLHERDSEKKEWRYCDPRKPGELLVPRLVTREVVEERKRKPLIWAAQDQQRPKKLAGNVFKPGDWRFWRFADEPVIEEFADRTVVIPLPGDWPNYFEESILSVDAAFNDAATSSRVAMGVWARRGEMRMLLACRWRVMSFTESRGELRSIISEVPWVGARLVEKAANGHAIIDSLTVGAESLDEAPMEGLIPITPEGSKEARAISISYLHVAKNLLLPLHAPYRDAAVREMAEFPKRGSRNDFVDMTSQAMRYWQQSRSRYENLYT